MKSYYIGQVKCATTSIKMEKVYRFVSKLKNTYVAGDMVGKLISQIEDLVLGINFKYQRGNQLSVKTFDYSWNSYGFIEVQVISGCGNNPFCSFLIVEIRNEIRTKEDIPNINSNQSTK